MRDLLRAPRRRPPTILPMRLAPTFPLRRRWPRNDGPVRAGHRTVDALLNVLTESIVDHELRGLRTLGRLLRLPLRHARPIHLLAGPGGSITAQLPGDRALVASDTAGDLVHAHALRAQQR